MSLMSDAQQPAQPSLLAAITPYELSHIPAHLAKAGLYDDLHRLLSLENGASIDTTLRPAVRSMNAWYVAAMAGGDLQMYLEHLNVAASVARDQTRQALKGGQARTALRHEARYALSLAAVRNVATNMSVRLLTTMVRQGALTVEDALAYVRQIPDARDRAEGLTTVLEMLSKAGSDADTPSDVATEALAAVSAIADEFWRVGELGRLAPHLPAHLGTQASSIAGTIADVSLRVMAFSMLGEPIEPALAKSVEGLPYYRRIAATEFELTDGAQSFRAEFTQRRAHAIANLIPFVREGAGRRITSAHWLAESYAALASESEQFLDAAISAAGRVGGWAAHKALLRSVAVWLTRSGKVNTALELLTAEAQDRSERLVLECEMAVAGGLPVTVAEVEAIPDPDAQLAALRSLLPLLSESEQHLAVAAVLRLTADRFPADGLTIVAPYLGDEGWRTAVGAARVLEDPEQRMRVIGVLAERAIALNQGDLPSVLSSLLSWIEDRFWYGQVVERLVPTLLEAAYPTEALRLAKTLPYPHRRAALIARCANGLTGTAREAAATSARKLAEELGTPGGRVRAKLLVAAAYPHEAEWELLDQAADLALGIEKGVEPLRSSTLASASLAFASHSQPTRALAIIDEIVDEFWRAEALTSVAEHGDVDSLEVVLESGRSLRSRSDRSRVITAVARRHAVLGSDALMLHKLWDEGLAAVALGSREECLHEIVTLLPVVAALGGFEAPAWIVAESSTTMRWWE